MNTTSKTLIIDLAKLRSAIRQAKQIIVWLKDEEGNHVCLIELTKKEALRRAIEQDKFDDYAAVLDGPYLELNGERQLGLRLARLPMRRAARHAEALARKASYDRAGIPVPDHVLKEIAASAPSLQPLVLEHGTATVPAASVAA